MCNCIEEKTKELIEKGGFVFVWIDQPHEIGIPVVRANAIDKKGHEYDLKLRLSYCPFCGKSYEVEAQNDSGTRIKVTSLEVIYRMVDGKPYFEIKYKKTGENFYHVGYSSFILENVLKWKEECFEAVD